MGICEQVIVEKALIWAATDAASLPSSSPLVPQTSESIDSSVSI